ncbi:TniQ family protein [Rhizobium sp. S152]|uniref:TniQ family protein n=1 Tax=Rhizobium sp. S152 TaxID=3055038 RepID=UPI0025A99AE1|nr:TniQ family protein [Rhizobium sp. S152]MDM9627855.1 TniQ family protein [Rhizobium sp. S152]
MLNRVEFHSSETLKSFLSRSAAANGAGDMRSLLKHLGTTYAKFSSEIRPSDEYVSAELGISAERLARARRSKAGSSARFKLNGHLLDRRSLWLGPLRYCALCLMDDMTTRTDRPVVRPFGRMSWTVESVSACPVHSIKLSIADNLGREPDDFARDVSSRWAVVEYQASRCERVELHACDHYFADRLDAREVAVPLVDEIPFYPAMQICENLGALVDRGPTALGMAKLPADELARLRHVGFDLLARGEGALRSFLTGAARRYWDTAAWHPMTSLFGNFYQVVSRNQNDYPTAVKILRDVVQNNLPVGPDDVFLGAPFERRLHTVATIVRQHAISYRAVRGILCDAGIIDESVRFTGDANIRIEGDVLRDTFEREANLVSQSSLIRITGMSDLFETCVFDPGWEYSLQPQTTYNRGKLYRISDAFDLLARLSANAGDHSGSDMVTVSEAARLAMTSKDEVIQLLAKGALQRVSTTGKRFSGITVSYLEVRENLAKPYCGALHYEDVSIVLNLPLNLVKSLMQDGALPVSLVELPGWIKTYPVIWPAALDVFTDLNVSVAELAARDKSTPEAVVAKLEDGGIFPSVKTRGGLPVFYSREVLGERVTRMIS